MRAHFLALVEEHLKADADAKEGVPASTASRIASTQPSWRRFSIPSPKAPTPGSTRPRHHPDRRAAANVRVAADAVAAPSARCAGCPCRSQGWRLATAPPWWRDTPARRGSRATAWRSARPSPLKIASAMWWPLAPARHPDVQRQLGVGGQGTQELSHQLGVEGADLGRGQQLTSTAQRRARRCRAPPAPAPRPWAASGCRSAGCRLSPIAWPQRLAQHDAHVLDGVVVVYLGVAARP